jgi:hypothetical protein
MQQKMDRPITTPFKSNPAAKRLDPAVQAKQSPEPPLGTPPQFLSSHGEMLT